MPVVPQHCCVWALQGPRPWSTVNRGRGTLFVVLGEDAVDVDWRTTMSPQFKQMHGERVSSRAYLYGAVLNRNEWRNLDLRKSFFTLETLDSSNRCIREAMDAIRSRWSDIASMICYSKASWSNGWSNRVDWIRLRDRTDRPHPQVNPSRDWWLNIRRDLNERSKWRMDREASSTHLSLLANRHWSDFGKIEQHIEEKVAEIVVVFLEFVQGEGSMDGRMSCYRTSIDLFRHLFLSKWDNKPGILLNLSDDQLDDSCLSILRVLRFTFDWSRTIFIGQKSWTGENLNCMRHENETHQIQII